MSWEQVSEKPIANCFGKEGLAPNNNVMLETNCTKSPPDMNANGYQELMAIDEDLLVAANLCGADICEALVTKRD